ncbi:MAG: DUF3667 domain-containing protein [Oceanicaulis sp.]
MEDGLDQAAGTGEDHVAASAAEPPSARARPSRPAVLASDVPEGCCANCRTPLEGPVCHQCGQLNDEFHRPVRGLLGEILEGLVAFDGRVTRTIPALLARPGEVTREFLKGRRARFMPPFRLYIIASLIFFFLAPSFDTVSGSVTGRASPGGAEVLDELEEAVQSGEISEEEAARARAVLEATGLAGSGAGAGDDEGAQAPAAPREGADSQGGRAESSRGVQLMLGRGAVVSGDDPEAVLRQWAPEEFGEPAPDTWVPLGLRRHAAQRFGEVAQDPGGWLEAAADWVPRIMFVMVPVYALLLSLVYAWRRGFFFFDHLIVSLHLHSALFLVMAMLLQLGWLIGAGWGWLAAIVYSNVYLYRLHRVVYARGRIASVLRTMTLDLLYLFVLMFGFTAVLLLGALA